MTELKTLSRPIQITAERYNAYPVFSMRWTIDGASGRPVCRWVTGHACAVTRLVPRAGASLRRS
jgi:hypothetical protein